ncbi:MAG TPA: hypothetical protein VMY42_05425, partial [Thermoguttaceae bacterium]|nr:hypothetical protein [Thermoguttaceae bacterium]
MMKRTILTALLIPAMAAAAFCREPVLLIDAEKPLEGWEFGNGPEFPGARGKFEVAPEPFRDQPVLSLYGDFTQGGNYVQAQIALPKAPLDTLTFWVNSPPGSERLPIRLMDAENQVHQLNLRLNEKGGWQQIVLPVEDFFKKMGTPEALDIVTRYETWDGVQDAQRHQKELPSSPSLAILASRAMGGEQGTLLFSDVRFYPSDETATSVAKTIQLDEMLQAGEIDWGFNLGQEFAGAQGGLDLVADQPEAGKYAMRLHADFTAGGAYVGVRKSFSQLNVEAMNAIRMKLRSTTAKSYALRLVDGTGQCHQRKGIALSADGKWHDVEIIPTEIAGGEHWGGANDAAWHDPVKLIELMLNVESDTGKKPELLISDMRADVTVKASVQPAAFAEGFQSEPPLAGWQTAGVVRLDAPGHGGQGKALVLERTLDALQTETRAIGRPFDVQAGMWQVQYAAKTELHSPD